MQNSKYVQSLAASYAVPPSAVFFSMLVSLGASPAEAYEATHTPRTFSAPGLKKEVEDFKRTHKGVTKLIEHFKSQASPQASAETPAGKKGKKGKNAEPPAGRYTDKGVIIAEMSQELDRLTGKDRIDALIKIADLQQMKKEETKEEEERVIYYLPLRCHDCELYRRKRDKK